MNYWGYAVGYGYLAVLLGIAELLSRHTHVNREVMRKVLHCLIGLEWLALYYFFPTSWQIVVIPASFIIVNLLSYRFKLFRAVERDTDNHYGTIYYALAMTGMSIATAIHHQLMLPFGIAVVCLSFGDAAAALIGRYCPPHVDVFGKSLMGVVGCFIFSLLAQFALGALLHIEINWTYMLALSVVSALTEVLSAHGTDNLFVCLWCFLWAYALYLNEAIIATLLMCYVAFVLTCVAYHTRAFTVVGSLLTGVMLAAIGVLGGWFAYLFILGSYGVIYVAEHFIKSSRYKETRTVRQILQNGLPALIVVILYRTTYMPFWLPAFAVAITQSLADSMASCVGNAYGGQAYDILTHRPVPHGLSGGITKAGTLAAMVVSILPVAVVGPLFGWQWYLVAVALLPFAGVMLDSVLGSRFQHKEQCIVCHTVCECTAHCSRPTLHYSGWRWLSNGRVNLICNLITTLAAALILYFVF